MIRPINPTRKQMQDMNRLQEEMHSVIKFINEEAARNGKNFPNHEDSVTVYILLKFAMIEDKLNSLINERKPELKN